MRHAELHKLFIGPLAGAEVDGLVFVSPEQFNSGIARNPVLGAGSLVGGHVHGSDIDDAC